MSFGDDGYTDTFTHIPVVTCISAYSAADIPAEIVHLYDLTDDTINRIADAVVKRLKEEQ